MTPAEYQERALRTMANQASICNRNNAAHDSVKMTQLNNAARGMAGDVGEVNTCVQRCLEYGKPLDLVNLKEELGDVLWRIVQACDAVGFTLEEVMQANIAKLSKRYPEKYTDELAAEENRNRDAERQAVSGGISESLKWMPSIFNDVHKLTPKAVEQFVRLALTVGWKIDASDQCVVSDRGDESWGWAAEWKPYSFIERAAVSGGRDRVVNVRVPHWLARRMYELGQIPTSFVFDVEVDNRDAMMEHLSEPTRRCALPLQQNGQGFAEPPEEKTEQPPLTRDRDYPTWCRVCGKVPVYRTSTSQTCPDCFVRQQGKLSRL